MANLKAKKAHLGIQGDGIKMQPKERAMVVFSSKICNKIVGLLKQRNLTSQNVSGTGL